MEVNTAMDTTPIHNHAPGSRGLWYGSVAGCGAVRVYGADPVRTAVYCHDSVSAWTVCP